MGGSSSSSMASWKNYFSLASPVLLVFYIFLNLLESYLLIHLSPANYCKFLKKKKKKTLKVLLTCILKFSASFPNTSLNLTAYQSRIWYMIHQWYISLTLQNVLESWVKSKLSVVSAFFQIYYSLQYNRSFKWGIKIKWKSVKLT